MMGPNIGMTIPWELPQCSRNSAGPLSPPSAAYLSHWRPEGGTGAPWRDLRPGQSGDETGGPVVLASRGSAEEERADHAI
jgi:hypothetical protein